ncbi:MAG: TonB-dependent receptor [Pseudomonadota bacterium]|nr:TonB-dependent receptor [Pseudomonadota bacterium]
MRFKHHMLALAVANLGALALVPAHADEAEKELDSVVTTATLTARDSAKVPAFSTVITAEDIARSPVTSLADLLRDTVGVNNYTDSLGRDELRIRGLGGEYTLILVNGKRVSSGAAFAKGSDADYSSIPLNSIERVEIIRGPMSSVYGADAIGGVLNIITKAPADEWQGNVSAEYRTIESGEDGDQYRVGGSVRGQLSSDLRMSLSAEQNFHDAWYADADDKDADEAPKLEEKKSSNLFTTFSYDVANDQTVDLDVGYNKDERPLGVYASGGRTRDQEITRLDIALTHTGEWDWGKTTAYVKHEDSDVRDFNSSYDAPQNHHTKEKNLYAKAYLNTRQGIVDILAGVDYRQQIIEDKTTYLQTGKLTIDEWAAFFQGEVAVMDDLSITLGGRYDDHEIFGNNFSPKVYAVYSLTDSITLKGGISEAFKAPDGSYLSPEYSVISCGGACYLAGNPDLEAESSTNYEAGIEVREAIWDLSLSWFKNDIDDLIERQITYDANDDPIAAEWINVAKAKTEGYELAASVDALQSLSFSGNYTYTDTEYTDADGETVVMEGRPEHQANLRADWRATDMLSASVSVNYLAGMQYSSSGEYPVLPSYYRTDLGLVAAVTSDLTLRAGVKNVTDVHLDEMDDNFNTFELGRNYYVSGSYNF